MISLKILFKKSFILIFGSVLLLYYFFQFNLSNFEGWKSERSYLKPRQLEIKEIKKYNLTYNKNEYLKSRRWYFYNGKTYPLPNKNQSVKLFPEDDSINDRIINQLMFVPSNYQKLRKDNNLKIILLYNGGASWGAKCGRYEFLNLKCPVDTCTITKNRDMRVSADMILYDYYFIPTGTHRPNKQIYMISYTESPLHNTWESVSGVINWTSTYRRDSDIVDGYGKWEYYDNNIKQRDQGRNYAINKTKKVAWFVTNCEAKNRRLQYANELRKYIDVDIYGQCGFLECPIYKSNKCFEILDKEYKFYLAFENSNCKDYITEKFFMNALQNNILPIVMGARPEDYEYSAPYRSYIHVDEFYSPKELADYLHILDKDEDLYNSYFKWKGTGEFLFSFFWCQVCAVLHNDSKRKWYNNLDEWWRGRDICTNGSWRNYNLISDGK